MNGISCHGMVFIHRAQRAILPHLEWAISRIAGNSATISWQPVGENQFRAELGWTGDCNTGQRLVAELSGWKLAAFEVTQEQRDEAEGMRWSYTPRLGLFQAQTDAIGNILLNEFQIKSALAEAGTNAIEIQRRLRVLMGQPWDDELENYRAHGELAPVIWLKAATS